MAGLAMASSMMLLTLALGGSRLIFDFDAGSAYLPHVVWIGIILLVVFFRRRGSNDLPIPLGKSSDASTVR